MIWRRIDADNEFDTFNYQIDRWPEQACQYLLLPVSDVVSHGVNDVLREDISRCKNGSTFKDYSATRARTAWSEDTPCIANCDGVCSKVSSVTLIWLVFKS